MLLYKSIESIIVALAYERSKVIGWDASPQRARTYKYHIENKHLLPQDSKEDTLAYKCLARFYSKVWNQESMS